MGFISRLRSYGYKNILTSKDITIAALLTLISIVFSNLGYIQVEKSQFVGLTVPVTGSILGLLIVGLSLYIAIAGRKFAIELMPNRKTYDQFIFLFEYTFYLLITSIAVGVVHQTLSISQFNLSVGAQVITVKIIEWMFFLYFFISLYAYISLLQFTSLIVNLMGRERIRQLFEERKKKTEDEVTEKL